MAAKLILFPLLASSGPTLSSWTKQVCYTQYATKSCAASTTTQTKSYTIPWCQTTTYTPSTTVTVAPSTVTSTTTLTDTSTSLGVQVIATTTSTLTSTETDTATSTITSTKIDTVTSTATTTIGTTSTIGTVSGFTPVASVPSVVQNGGGTRAKRDLSAQDAIEERDAELEERSPELEERAATTSKTSANPSPTLLSDCDQLPKYPSVVKCYKAVVTASISHKTVYGTKTSTFTVGNPTTTTVTSTVRSTTTTTVLPAVTTVTSSTTTTSTTTITTTATSAVTSTTTVTTTTTSYLAAQTAYAACAPDNLINMVGSSVIRDAIRNRGTNYVYTQDQTADACCAACQAGAGCAAFNFRASSAAPSCGLIIVDGVTVMCNATAEAVKFIGRSRTTTFVATVGNGPCGQGSWDGVKNT